MKLYASRTSPYARKVRIVMAHKRLAETIEIIWASPFENSPNARELRILNPLNKIPALQFADGEVVFDSRVICELLDDIGDGPRLLSADCRQRARERTIMALADGILDAAFALTMEERKPAAQQSPEWIARWSAAIRSSIAAIDWDSLDQWGLPEIGIVCALDYLAFRQPAVCVLPSSASRWRLRADARPNVAATVPR